MAQNKKRVLLVEDDSAIVDVYTTILQKGGFNVQTVTEGKEAIKIIKNIQDADEGRPDIVLLDLILPDINGVEVLREIKTNDKTKDILVFVLTNQEGVELQGSNGVKPDRLIIKANITPTQLLEIVKNKLN